jgi:hypothetical protein
MHINHIDIQKHSLLSLWKTNFKQTMTELLKITGIPDLMSGIGIGLLLRKEQC